MINKDLFITKYRILKRVEKTSHSNKGQMFHFLLATYLPCSRENAPLWLSASQPRSSSCPAGSSPLQQVWEWYPSGSWSRSQSCSLPGPRPLGQCVPTNWRGKQKLEHKADIKGARSKANNYRFMYLPEPLPVFIFGKPLHHAFFLQTCQDIGCFLWRPCHHMYIGGLTLVHCSLHKIGYRWG